MSKINNILVEKYRPTSMKDYVFSDERERRKVEKWVAQKEIPNVLAFGAPGVGKSSLATVLIHELDVDPSDVKLVNGATVGVGKVTEEIVPWMQMVPAGDFKILVLEEIDRMSDAAMKTIRFEMDNHADTVRVFATTNYINKVIPSLMSRFQTVQIDSMDEDALVTHIVDIAQLESMYFDEPEDLMSHIEAYQPDLRKILNSIQEHTEVDGKINRLLTAYRSEDAERWSSVWAQDSIDVADALDVANEVNESNFEEFYKVMADNSAKFPDEVKGVVLLSQYNERAYRCANQPLHLKACLFHIFLLDE